MRKYLYNIFTLKAKNRLIMKHTINKIKFTFEIMIKGIQRLRDFPVSLNLYFRI